MKSRKWKVESGKCDAKMGGNADCCKKDDSNDNNPEGVEIL